MVLSLYIVIRLLNIKYAICVSVKFPLLTCEAGVMLRVETGTRKVLLSSSRQLSGLGKNLILPSPSQLNTHQGLTIRHIDIDINEISPPQKKLSVFLKFPSLIELLVQIKWALFCRVFSTNIFMAYWVMHLATNRRNIIYAFSYPLISLHYHKINENLEWRTAFSSASYSVWLTRNKKTALLLWLLQAFLVLYWDSFQLCGYEFLLLLHLVQYLLITF
jgi:hypothetical protein